MNGAIKKQANNMSAILSLKNISKTFKDDNGKKHKALDDIDLEIASGEFFVILGPSGSGKSTLLRIMSDLEKEFEGKLSFSGDSEKNFGFVFQQFALLPWLTVYENIELGLIPKKVPQKIRHEKIMNELKIFELEGFANSYPKELSGGMRQRVGLARALVIEPQIIFMDEPFSELDSFTATKLRKELLEIWQKRKMTVVLVTHLVEEAIELADRIAVLTPRPAKIESIIQNTITRPRHKRSEEFYTLEDKIYQIIKP